MKSKSQLKIGSKLKKLMHKQFLPNSYKHDLYLKVSSVNQGHLSVEYIYEFERLHIRSGIKEELEQTMARFLRGLDPSTEKVNIQPYWSFEDVF